MVNNALQPAHDLLLSDRSRILVITVEDNLVTKTSCHFHASKQITVLGGCAEIKLHDSYKKLYEGQSIYIPNGMAHKIINVGKIPLKYVEIRTGPYVMDDDQLT
jgi:mannose-6-phosphate isomerase-like protein (cupin superfamily)